MFGKSKIELTEGSISKNLFFLSLPLVFSNLLQSAYNIVDTFWLGRLGGEAVAAISFAWPVVFLIIAVGAGLGMAGSILLSQYAGARDQRGVDLAVGQTSTFLFFGAVFISVFGLVLAKPLLGLLGAEDLVLQMAWDYLRILFAGVVLMFGFFMFSSLMQGWGDTTTPFYIMLFSTGLNLVLDPLLIFGYYGFPALGVAGAAYATVFSRGVAAVIGFYILLSGRKGLRLRLSCLKPDFGFFRRMVSLGFPVSLDQGLRGLGMMVMTYIVALFGTSTVAAYGIGIRVMTLMILPSLAVSMALTSMVGQNQGAGFLKRARRSGVISGVGVFVILGFLTAVVFFGAEFISQVFIKDVEVVRISTGFLKILSLSFCFTGLAITLNGAFNGAGKTFQAMAISMSALWVIRIPFAYVFSESMGVSAVWWSFPVAAVFSAIVGILYFRFGRWQDKTLVGPKEVEPLGEPIFGVD